MKRAAALLSAAMLAGCATEPEASTIITTTLPQPASTTTTFIPRPPAGEGSWGIPVAAEECEGYDPGFYQTDEGEASYIVDLREAWCSGIRDPAFGTDAANQAQHDGRCAHLAAYVEVKIAWDATMDKAEHDSIARELGNCAAPDAPTTTT